MIDQSEDYEDQRARAWQHKQQLDNLPTFNDKLKYFIENVNPYLSSTNYIDGENAPFTVGVKPQTDEDRRELHRVVMNYHRSEYASQKQVVKRFATDERAFYVRPLDELKADLALRLSTAARKEDLLQKELANTTRTIDAVGKPVVDRDGKTYSPVYANVVEELRDCLETNRDYNFAFMGEHFPFVKALKLAYVWDIVHYEAYLKDELARLKRAVYTGETFINSATSTPPAANKERSEGTQRKARQAVTFFEEQINNIVQRERGKQRPKSADEIVSEAITQYCLLAVGRNLATTEKGLNRYLKDIGKTQTARKYGGQLVGQYRSNK